MSIRTYAFTPHVALYIQVWTTAGTLAFFRRVFSVTVVGQQLGIPDVDVDVFGGYVGNGKEAVWAADEVV
jgi:hypothetical protein